VRCLGVVDEIRPRLRAGDGGEPDHGESTGYEARAGPGRGFVAELASELDDFGEVR
jgi:hypothetical protein